jgi:WD40 repeat protein
VSALAISADGHKLAAASDADFRISLWDLSPESKRDTLVGHNQLVRTLSFHVDGSQLVSADAAGNWQRWMITNRTTARSWPTMNHTSWQRDVQPIFSPVDGTLLLVDSNNVILQYEDTRPDRAVRIDAPGRPSAQTGASFSNDGQLIATRHDNVVRVWETSTANLLGSRNLSEPMPDGDLITAGMDAAGTRFRRIHASGHGVEWGRAAGPIASMDVDLSSCVTGAFSANLNVLALVRPSRRAVVWDLATRRLRHQWPEPTSSVAISGDGRWIVLDGPYAGRPLLLSVEGERASSLGDAGVAIRSHCAIDHLGNSVAWLESDQQRGLGQRPQVLVWRRPDQQGSTASTPFVAWSGRGPVLDVALSADGNILVVVEDVAVHVIDLITGRHKPPFNPAALGPFHAVAFNRTGQWMATAHGGRIAIWATLSGELPRTLADLPFKPIRLDFSGDGETLTISSHTESRITRWRETQ